MTRILALDSATEACSAALLIDGATTSRSERREREHGPALVSMTDSLLGAAGLELRDLDALAFGCGPGSFTGLRIAAGITQGFALTAALPVLPISNLAILAQTAIEEEDAEAVAVCLDARMGQVFAGYYRRDERGLARPLQDDALSDPGALTLPHGIDRWLAVGDGWERSGEAERLARGAEIAFAAPRLPEARFALRLAKRDWDQGLARDASEALPVYLRGKAAWRRAGP